MTLLPKNSDGCPFLLLAPMEGIGDRTFRKAMAQAACGFDEAVTEFISVPSNAHVKSLAKIYLSDETAPIPLAAQIMGNAPELMAAMTESLQERGAHRIDLNCGCPSNTVTGRGAGSSLLKCPTSLYTVAKSMVKAAKVPITLKMRSGFQDTSLFKENLLAAQESGVHYITLHPRTKEDGYGPPAKWELIAEAKSLLKIPVVGNGDILTKEDALKMLKMTKCDALMIGRGSVINPFIFHEIKAHFSSSKHCLKWKSIKQYLDVYLSEIHPGSPMKNKINKLKQLMSFLFKRTPKLLEKRQVILTSTPATLEAFMEFALPILQEYGEWN